MDQAKNMGWPAQLVSCICGCGCLAAGITFIVYLGIYAFNNPEAQTYYIAGSDTTQAELVPIVPNVDAEGVTPIHDQFITWFKWMFANSLVPTSFACIGPLLMCLMAKSPCLGNTCSGAVFCSWVCSGLAVYILGLVWRYGEAGKFASGDDLDENVVAGPLMQISNGKFMSIYYLITWIALGVSCFCTCLGGIITMCCK